MSAEPIQFLVAICWLVVAGCGFALVLGRLWRGGSEPPAPPPYTPGPPPTIEERWALLHKYGGGISLLHVPHLLQDIDKRLQQLEHEGSE